jgi:hypothetical protein
MGPTAQIKLTKYRRPAETSPLPMNCLHTERAAPSGYQDIKNQYTDHGSVSPEYQTDWCRQHNRNYQMNPTDSPTGVRAAEPRTHDDPAQRSCHAESGDQLDTLHQHPDSLPASSLMPIATGCAHRLSAAEQIRDHRERQEIDR